jgi:putative ABC transport system ATP-binding protein
MILSIRNLTKIRPLDGGTGYRLVVPALDVRAGEKVLITGPSGAGKSTFLDLLGMVLKPDAVEQFVFAPEKNAADSGRVKSRDIGSAWTAGRLEDLALWRRSVGYVLQTGGLLPFLTVRENIEAPRRLAGLEIDGSVDALAEKLGITLLLHKLPAQLSVGERQRAAIARALAAGPALVLADEPTAALDPLNAESVLGMFSDMVSELGVTLILVTHAPEQMAGMGFRRLEVRQHISMEQGREAVLDEYAGEEVL